MFFVVTVLSALRPCCCDGMITTTVNLLVMAAVIIPTVINQRDDHCRRLHYMLMQFPLVLQQTFIVAYLLHAHMILSTHTII